jgi:NTP pyrophosphatase (non-canonical NTP hydrolase)
MAENTKENSYTPYPLNEYQDDAMSVRLGSANEEYAFLGLAGEVGEIYSLRAKAVRDGYLVGYNENMKKELGDVLWFVAAIAADNGYTLEDIARANIDKLFSRKERGTLQGSGDNR